MAVGDDASAAGYPLVPGSGSEGMVKYGAREINRTRDIAAQIKNQIPVGMAGYRSQVKMSYGTGMPGSADGVEGEIYFRVI